MTFAYHVLGTLRVYRDDSPIVIAASKPRTVLAYVLLKPDRVVTVEELADEVWGASPPRSAIANLRTYIADLRRAFGGRGVAPINAGRGGYQLASGAGELDADAFRSLLASGRAAAAHGDRSRAAEQFSESLRLWRGAALDGVPVGPVLASIVRELNEDRWAVIEQLAQIRLDLGHDAEVVSLLREHVADQPLREEAQALLMTALYRRGNVAGALDAFHCAREALVSQLGIEPGPALADLHRLILNRDPALQLARPQAVAGHRAAAADAGKPDEGGSSGNRERRARGPTAADPGTASPWQVPAAPRVFIGRDDELATLVAAASAPHGPRVIAIHGPAGTGKTALALTVARAMIGSCPDGNLFQDLRGAAHADLRRAAATNPASWLLQGAGMAAAEVPADAVHAAAIWRSVASERRMVIVLDDASSADDVAALLPAARGCLTIVTSRRMLPELDAHHLGLTPLQPQSARTLLRALAGASRMDEDPAATLAIAKYCGHLPLALQIISARLARRPGYPLARLADRLADERRRLDELEIDGVGVRSSLQFSYEALRHSHDPIDALAAAAFRLRGLVGLPINARSLAAGLDRDIVDTDAALDRLIEMRLVETDDADLLQMHDLLRIYAAEKAAAEAVASRESAVRRVYEDYLRMSREVVATVRPYVPLIAARSAAGQPPRTAELERELPTLLAIARHGSRQPDRFGDLAVDLLLPLSSYLPPRGHWELLGEFGELAVQTATYRGDRAGRARALTALALVDAQRGHTDAATARLTEAMTIRTELDDRRAQASILDNLGLIHQRTGQPEAAFACYARALRLHREF
ncbi:MAG: hypothetical protein QOI74_3547, partial [Micromonosporaceae bacterium]|nr:hypothetical protein [Micromonosporaceae bacterium]